MGASKYFSKEEQNRIVSAIVEAEKNTSGEIRVHIDLKCKEDVLDHAAWLFHTLKMDKTSLRNGVLIYLAIESHKFAIIGDQGINQTVPENFWEETKEGMFELFKKGNYTDGIVLGIRESGEKLKAFFPYHKEDANELSDEISFGGER